MTSIHIGRQWHDDPRQLLLRPFEHSSVDLDALASVRNATLRPATLPEHYRDYTGPDMERFYERGGFTLEGNCWLVFFAGSPAAAALVYPPSLFHDRPPGNFDMYVAPEYRRHGLGSRILSHLEQAAAARGYPTLEVTIAAEDAGSTRFLAAQGFAVVGHSMHLTRYGLDNLPEAVLPDGFGLVTLAGWDDAGPDLYIETTNRLGAYDPNYTLVRREEIDAAVADGTWDPAGIIFVVDAGGRPVGVIRAVAGTGGSGYLHEMRLEPSLRGMGLGRAMLAGALLYLAQSGAVLAELDTSGENAAAHRLALSAGFQLTRHWLHFLKALRPSA